MADNSEALLAEITHGLSKAEAAEVVDDFHYDDEAAERKARYYRLTRAGGIGLPRTVGPYTRDQLADLKRKGVR